MANIRIPKDYTKKVFKSVHNRGTIRRTTAHAGLMIPVYSRRVMAGEKVMISPTTVVQTNALLAPLFGSFTLQLAFFFDSDSNYYGWMDNNARLTTQELLSRMRHRANLYDFVGAISHDATYENWVNNGDGVRRHSLLEYYGFPVGSVPVTPSGSEGRICNPSVDLGFFFTYLNIFRNYYCNNQENTFPFVADAFVFNGNPFEYANLSILDDLFRELRFQKDGIDLSTSVVEESQYPGLYWFLNSYMQSQITEFGGLIPCTYRPDLMVNLLNKTNNVQSFVNVEDGKFSIDTLRFQNKLQRLIDRFDVSGGRFSNWLRAVWGVKTRKDMDIPELIGITQKLIDPTDLVNKSSGITEGDGAGEFRGSYLGDQGGNFNKIHNHRGHSFYASTSGRVMCIMTLVPNVDYSQGTDYECTKVSFADDYVPEFAQLGFQNVPLSRYSSLPIFSNGTVVMRDPYNETVGKEVAWLPEMTDVNRNYGQYAWNGFQSYWVLSRLYSRSNGELATMNFSPSISQYINPLEYQYPFVAQSVNDPNWQIQVGFKVRAVRPIGKRFMPNLE